MMSKQHRQISTALCMLALTSTASIAVPAPDSTEPATLGGPATFRRLDEAQYANSIADIFGSGIKVPGRFDPPWREDGLLAIGDGKVVVSSSGLEQDELRARNIAAQVLTEDHRKSVVSCAPQSAATFDESCARQVIGKYGRLLYRRPLDQEEMISVLQVARTAAKQTGDFNTGLEAALARLLASPNFIFRVEQVQKDAGTGRTRLDDYSLAARISFLLWNAPADDMLLDAAAAGALREKKGLAAQVERLMASPHFEQGMRAFFSDLFAYERFDNLSKDQSLFPVYSSQMAKDAKEQALRTTLDLLLTKNGDYRDLFTTQKTFMNRNMGALYGVAVEEGAVGGWVPYTFGVEDHRAGLLTLAGFLMLDPSHEGRSSPTIRGKSVREIFLCQKVPPPPGAVDFKLVEDTHNPVNKTARERLTAHRENPVCAGCHSVMDPIGLSMENYDAIGNYRITENEVPIDASGTFDGKSYKDVIELEQTLHNSPGLTNCLARRVYEYGAGRSVTSDEREWLKYLNERFADAQYGFPNLMRIVATSRAFQAVAASTTVASN
jgi:Protein of unknown function (DUF1592)/Protein of unknown function (DUF1588)/Protein of unknown function (DUF1595)/Protein of unknown function (DUF1585)